jgi:hypothetical protein
MTVRLVDAQGDELMPEQGFPREPRPGETVAWGTGDYIVTEDRPVRFERREVCGRLVNWVAIVTARAA